MDKEQKPSVFISYATEDYEKVILIYDYLEKIGLYPWMDKKNLIAGEDWERALWKAARKADFFVICLSHLAITKRSFLQREIKRALTIWEEKLEDDIYVLPIKIEECEIPESLLKFQWINLFEENGFEIISKSIMEGANRRNIAVNFSYVDKTDIKIVTKKLQEENKGKSPYSIDIEYPQFDGSYGSWQQEINQLLSGVATKYLHKNRKFCIERIDDFDGEFPGEVENSIDISYTVSLLKYNLLSLEFGISSYFAGAAHGNFHAETFVFRIDPAYEVKLEDFFNEGINYLEIISAHCTKEIKKQWEEEYSEPLNDSIWLDGLSPEEKNFKTFIITEKSIEFIFPPYQVGPYVWGTRFVVLEYYKILEHLKNKGVLLQILSKY